MSIRLALGIIKNKIFKCVNIYAHTENIASIKVFFNIDCLIKFYILKTQFFILTYRKVYATTLTYVRYPKITLRIGKIFCIKI